MRPIRAVIFDLDGTLIDSVPDIATALNASLARTGRPPISEEGVARLVGGGARELVHRALGEAAPAAEVERVLQAFLAGYAAEPAARTRLYPGARTLLETLHGQGMTLALCTNKPLALTDLILGALDLARYFAVVWGAEPGKPLKPDAACLLGVCAALGVAPDATLMIGDSHADIAAARAAGCHSIVVRQGYEVRPAESLGADRVASDLGEVTALLAHWAREGHFAVAPVGLTA